MKKTRNILVSLLTCLFVILAVPATVSAAAKAPQCPKKQTLEFYRAYTSYGEILTDGDGYIYIKNLSRSAVITNVRSSNKYYTASKAAGLNAIYVQTTSGSDHYVKDGEKTKKRLEILNQSNDGFYIAREDLRLRGPGDLFGIRQSGELIFRIGDVYQDAAILMEANEAVKKTLEDPHYPDGEEYVRFNQILKKYMYKDLCNLNL